MFIMRTVRRYFEEDYFVIEEIIRFCDQETCNSRDDLTISSSYSEIWEINTGVLMKSSIQRVWIDDPDPFVEDDERKYTEKFELTNEVYFDNHKQNDGFLGGNNSIYSLFFGFGILLIFRKK